MLERELGQVYRLHGAQVHRRCRKVLGNEDEAHDACQEVFLKLLETPSLLQQPGNLTAWLYRVTTNLCIDRLRGRKDHDPARLEGLGNGDSVGQAETRAFLGWLLRSLSTEETELAFLRYVDGCTLEEMEEICGLTRKTIQKRLDRIRKRATRMFSDGQRAEG